MLAHDGFGTERSMRSNVDLGSIRLVVLLPSMSVAGWTADIRHNGIGHAGGIEASLTRLQPTQHMTVESIASSTCCATLGDSLLQIVADAVRSRRPRESVRLRCFLEESDEAFAHMIE